MLKHISLALFVVPCLSASALAQYIPQTFPTDGPDIALSEVGTEGSSTGGMNEYSIIGGEIGYAFATTSCNVGDERIDWFSGINNDHPVIAQNMFRVSNGRLEQLGYGFLKHGFFALSQPGCTVLSCQSTNGSELGIGCADTYSAGLNNGDDGSSKKDANATLGTWTGSTLPVGGGNAGRLRVTVAELNQPGAQYFMEGQYISNEDAQRGMNRNSQSCRLVNTANPSQLVWIGNTVRYLSAVDMWNNLDSTVLVDDFIVPDEGGPNIDGTYVVGSKATSLGAGQWRYEYAVQNLTSHQGARAFTIPTDCASISNPFFRDVNAHSGDPYSTVDWTFSTTGGVARWSTETQAQNSNANAIRWGEVYSFGFTADSAPQTSTATLDMFQSGASVVIGGDIQGPCPGSFVVCGSANFCTSAVNSSGAAAIMTSSGSVSVSSNDLVLHMFGAATSQPALMYYGPNEIAAPFGNGTRCVGGTVSRLNPPAFTTVFGDISRPVDNTVFPMNSGAGQVTAGSTHKFQGWFRDPNAGGAGFDLSDGLSITFCP
jgi:hypothetical protein